MQISNCIIPKQSLNSFCRLFLWKNQEEFNRIRGKLNVRVVAIMNVFFSIQILFTYKFSLHLGMAARNNFSIEKKHTPLIISAFLRPNAGQRPRGLRVSSSEALHTQLNLLADFLVMFSFGSLYGQT